MNEPSEAPQQQNCHFAPADHLTALADAEFGNPSVDGARRRRAAHQAAQPVGEGTILQPSLWVRIIQCQDLSANIRLGCGNTLGQMSTH